MRAPRLIHTCVSASGAGPFTTFIYHYLHYLYSLHYLYLLQYCNGIAVIYINVVMKYINVVISIYAT